MISAGGCTANQMAFGSDPVGLSGRENNDEDMMFTQDTSPSEQFAQPRKLRMRTKDAALKEVANSKLRRPLA